MVSFLKRYAQEVPQTEDEDIPESPQSPSTEIDFETLTAKVAGVDVYLMGLSDRIISFLALHGAVALLRRRRNPQKTWDDIVSERILAPRTNLPPVTVRAWADLTARTYQEAYNEWKTMTRAEQGALRRRPDVMKRSLEIRYPELSEDKSDESAGH